MNLLFNPWRRIRQLEAELDAKSQTLRTALEHVEGYKVMWLEQAEKIKAQRAVIKHLRQRLRGDTEQPVEQPRRVS